jgi:thioredoxin-related protein
MMFSSTSCPYCTKFIKETYPNNNVQTLIMNNFVFIELNERSPKAHFKGQALTYGQLLQGFGIRGTPSFVFFTQNSTPITILPGYVGPDVFSKVLKYIAQQLYSKNISFSDYMKKTDKFIGEKKIIKIENKDVDFILQNDVFAKKIASIKNAGNKYYHYIVYNSTLANELLKDGFFNIFLVVK